jgi:hypothetical protein
MGRRAALAMTQNPLEIAIARRRSRRGNPFIPSTCNNPVRPLFAIIEPFLIFSLIRSSLIQLT